MGSKRQVDAQGQYVLFDNLNSHLFGLTRFNIPPVMLEF